MPTRYIVELEPQAWFCTDSTIGRTGSIESATRFDNRDLAEFALNLSKLLASCDNAKIHEVTE